MSDWSTLRSPQFDRAAAARTVAVLPIGSTEQHGPHLPVHTDTLLAAEVAQRTAALCEPTLPVLVLPALWVSLAEHHMALPGTLTLDHETLLAFVRCIARSLVRQGHRRILLLNGHGGNIAALTAAVDRLSPEFPEAVLAVATYWNVAAEAFAEILQSQPTLLHACEAETSMLMHLRPHEVDARAAEAVSAPASGFLQPAGMHRWRPIGHWSCSGVVGNPRRATAAKGRQLLDAAAAALAERLRDEEFWAAPVPEGR